jgi:hypothetical protein
MNQNGALYRQLEAPYYDLNVAGDSPPRRSNRGNEHSSSSRGRNLEMNIAHNSLPLRVSNPSVIARHNNAA